ncbi:hypothetical protein P9239_22050 [Caballeronia sp. LZ062]|uniref:hypothetical protein n=1 Tax=unclassified Caballeronia TaxID=2646786 RepID=UPI002860D5B1|nr:MULTISPECIES: hypothetical protein [unclassified Caballeronia]MDR5856366.1 hypothetical protein [Caballeronia sp. LZ050]MDR5873036.1 hypothetical protein [Caballeronia sp. LZ062]
MYVFSWFLSMIVALAATGAILFALPGSAAEELTIATAPQAMLASDANPADAMLASCVGEGKQSR